MGETFISKIKSYSVIDGDTVRCYLDFGFRIYHSIDCRFSGINAPEVTGTEKLGGLAVKAFVDKWLAYEASFIQLHSHELDKFAGRCLGDIVSNGQSLVLILIALGVVKEWNGRGKRPVFSQGEIERIIRTLT